ncbi:MAG: hypothetical protein KDN22_23115 [Verrucomicrobiae bacterium]|nr:hypothetical protein [Verrucomicrobiae bacterium]
MPASEAQGSVHPGDSEKSPLGEPGKQTVALSWICSRIFSWCAGTRWEGWIIENLINLAPEGTEAFSPKPARNEDPKAWKRLR